MAKTFKPSILLLLFTLVTACQSQQPDRPPNIVVIFFDDMGYGDPVSFGGIGYETPHMDRMAAEGMRFTHFYVPQARCSASRAALLTGAYPNRVGGLGVLFPWSEIALDPEEETIADLLRGAGYRTGMMGKWHLGFGEGFLPLDYGFDEYVGIPYSNDMWPVEYDGTPITDPEHPKYRYDPLPLIEGNETVRTIDTLEDQDELTAYFTERAVRFIRENRDDPFFLYLAHPQPHVPLAVSDRFRGRSEAGFYGDVMMELDWSVGEIVRTIDELGIAGETLVVVTSDNGPWLNYGNHSGSTAGLREGKGTQWEGGVRVPAIMQWRGTIPEGVVNNRLAATIDLLPTFSSLAGAALPERKIDGVDITPLLLNREGVEPREYMIFYYDRNSLQSVRKGEWKLVFAHEHRTYTLNPPGMDGWPGPQPIIPTDKVLYNLRIDPGESIDMLEAFPDVVHELEELADRYRRELGDDLVEMEGRERRPPARVR